MIKRDVQNLITTYQINKSYGSSIRQESLPQYELIENIIPLNIFYTNLFGWFQVQQPCLTLYKLLGRQDKSETV